jgi:hypothetical protein
MLSTLTKLSGSASMAVVATLDVRAGDACRLLCVVTGAPGCFTNGCVVTILMVALGNPVLLPSGGKVIRAVSFFGEAALCVTSSGGGLAGLVAGTAGATGLATLVGAAAGLSGMVGLAPSEGGLGGGLIPLKGLTPEPKDDGGLGGGGT